MRITTLITHWLPIVSFCPENGFPDLIYVEVKFDSFVELYAVRKRIKKLCSGKKLYMEAIAAEVAEEFPMATMVRVRLMFNKHVVEVTK